VYDFGGDLMEVLTVRGCCKKYRLSKSALRGAILRGSLWVGKLYFSKNSEFKINTSKHSQNGLNPNKYKTMRGLFGIKGEPDFSDYQDYLLKNDIWQT
jgi:hypothetical protein